MFYNLDAQVFDFTGRLAQGSRDKLATDSQELRKIFGKNNLYLIYNFFENLLSCFR